jgi:hypothetical protein
MEGFEMASRGRPPKRGEATQQVAFRFTRELLNDVDDFTEDFEEDNPGVSLSRADAVRMLVSRGLEAHKADQEKVQKYWVSNLTAEVYVDGRRDGEMESAVSGILRGTMTRQLSEKKIYSLIRTELGYRIDAEHSMPVDFEPGLPRRWIDARSLRLRLAVGEEGKGKVIVTMALDPRSEGAE